MLRPFYALLTAIVFLVFFALGCSGSKDLTKLAAPTMASIKPAKGLSKKIAIVLAGPKDRSIDGRVSELFLNAIVKEVQDEDDDLRLVTVKDGTMSLFLATLGDGLSEPPNAPGLFEEGRRAGYHGLMRVAVRNVRAFTKKTGYFWFRKPRRFLSLNFILDLYDPLTAAKIVGAMEEVTIKISDAEYDMLVNDQNVEIDELIDTVEDQSEELAEQVTETLEALPWQISVVEIGPHGLVLPAGLIAGLNQDDHLAVIEGQRFLTGLQGKRYVVPGKRIAEVRITQIDDQKAEAEGEGLDAVKVGDILVPIR